MTGTPGGGGPPDEPDPDYDDPYVCLGDLGDTVDTKDELDERGHQVHQAHRDLRTQLLLSLPQEWEICPHSTSPLPQ